MRLRLPAMLAACLLAAAPAAAQQSLLGNTGPDTQDAAPQPLGSQDLGPPVAVPPAPPITPAAPAAPTPVVIGPPAPPGQVQTQMPPANADSGNPAPVDNAQPGAPGAAPAPAPGPSVPSTADSMPPPATNDWVPQKTASLGILDKVDGSTAALTIPVGGQSSVGDLLVDVLACVSRPAGEVPDDAVFVSIQPVVQSDGGPIFRGWMLRSIPGATVVGDASETFRVVGCD